MVERGSGGHPQNLLFRAAGLWTDGRQDRQMDGGMVVRTDFPCILRDIIPFGTAAQKTTMHYKVALNFVCVMLTFRATGSLVLFLTWDDCVESTKHGQTVSKISSIVEYRYFNLNTNCFILLTKPCISKVSMMNIYWLLISCPTLQGHRPWSLWKWHISVFDILYSRTPM